MYRGMTETTQRLLNHTTITRNTALFVINIIRTMITRPSIKADIVSTRAVFGQEPKFLGNLLQYTECHFFWQIRLLKMNKRFFESVTDCIIDYGANVVFTSLLQLFPFLYCGVQIRNSYASNGHFFDSNKEKIINYYSAIKRLGVIFHLCSLQLQLFN